MEFTIKLDATPDEFFDRLENSIIADIRVSTGKAVSADKLNGYKYEKVTTGRRGVPLKVKIKAYRRPERYEARFTSGQGANAINYRVSPLPGGGIAVAYSESFSGAQSQRGLFAGLNGKLYDFRVKHHAKGLLKSIERDIKQARKSGVDKVVLPDELAEDEKA